jgi:broad specificity phosphatase PhoE
MMNVYLYRHGQTLFNTKGIVQGRGVDSSLNEKGLQQADDFFQFYKEIPFDLLLTSTLKRTIETAKPFEDSGIPVERFTDLEEIDWGIYEGKPADEQMHSAYLGLLKSWSDGNYDDCMENGDSAAQMGERLNRVVNYIKTLKHKNILICTHGGCMAYLMTILQDLPLSDMPKFRHHNTGLCLFEYNGKQFHLKKQDDIAHLKNK